MKAGIIGLGRMGRRHIKVVKHLGLELAGVFDIKKESIEAAIDEENIKNDIICSSAEDLFKKNLDCIIIATTANFHFYYTKMAAEAKIPFILCEKPMATSLSECDEMINICEKNNCKLAINHQMRFMEQYTKVKEIIEREEFGGLSSVNVVAGNMGFAMNGTHYFELFRYITNEMAWKVTAWFSKEIVPNPRGSEFEDRAGQIRVETKSGKRFYIEIGADQGHWILVSYAGKNGLLLADELNGEIHYFIREKEYLNMPTTRYAMPGKKEIIKVSPPDIILTTALVLKAMFEGKDYPTGEDGKNAISVLVASYKSAENGNTAVKVNEIDSYYDKKFPWA